MDGSPNRLVGRLQKRLQSTSARGHTIRLTLHEMAELEARIRRLQTLVGRHPSVRLSRYVAERNARNVHGRVGGECVATEV